jgi:chromosome segregation ATPase
MKLWEENSNIRKSLENRENQTRTRESALDKRLKDLEEREERLNVSKGSQLERYQYLQNKIQQERSVADKYKEELNRLRDSIEKQKMMFDNKQFEMNNEISRVKDECTARVDRYRRMYEEGEKLLDELRLRSLKSPELVPKIDQVEQRMNSKVQEAIKNTVELQKSPNPTVVQQTTIDNKLLEDMKKLVSKVDDIEKKLQTSNPESAHWYNNKYAVV